MKKTFAIAVAALAMNLPAQAQTQAVRTIVSGNLPEGIVIGPDGRPMPATSSEGASQEKEEKPKADSERTKLLKALKYDRRPSAILEAWSTPPEPEEEEAEDEPADGEQEGGADAAEAQASGAEEDTAEGDVAGGEASDADAPPPPGEGTQEEQAASDDAAGAEDAEGEVDPAEAEAAAAAKAEEEAAAEEARLEAERAAAEKKKIEAEMKALQRNVTLGAWEEVKTYFADLTEDEGKAGYTQLIKSLVEGYVKPSGQFAAYAEKNFFEPADLIGIATAAPMELEPDSLTKLAMLLKTCVAGGSLIEECIQRYAQALDSDDFALKRVQFGRILIEAGYPVESGEYLPTPEQAVEDNDRATLNLLSRHLLARHAKEKKGDLLEQAWSVIQSVLASGELEKEDKEEALKRAVDIAPQVREELGQAWLDESFTARPERGMEILRVIGSAASQGMFAQARYSDRRLKNVELQTTATNALIANSPELAAEWKGTLSMLATNWLREAEFTYRYGQSTSRGPMLQRDPFGNFFYYNNRGSSTNRNMPAPISTDDVLDIRPSQAWLDLIAEELRPKFDMVTAQLLLKVNEEAEAFPYIEELALSHPERAKDLAEEFLRVWARNNNPNSSSAMGRTNSYMFIYGFDQRSNSIPLTRSKQERNLLELSEWIARLRALPIEKIDENLITSAFTAAHSTAEVYRLETIEKVFGKLEDLEPKTLAQLVQRMRSNLVGIWRQPATQKDKNTRRRQKDIQTEVLRGYQVAGNVIDSALESHPDDWSLMLARASVMHDENNYAQEIEKTSEFTGRRQESFEVFRRAAELYVEGVPELREDEENTQAFETWFYASLGACDLNAIDHEQQPVPAQVALIREALEAIPGEGGERHMAMFANSLFTRMSSVNPAVKFGYVRSGLDIVGDHERAREARKVFVYYNDLVTEIQLVTRVDGAAEVGEAPFGLFVDLRHTREIERESGGFAKYLVNQNNQQFAYNYGRPTENYRDKFEEIVRTALGERFEVLSITFNRPEVHSIAEPEYGWRVTPYAHILLKARGPEVDRIPSLHLDLDFLDTTGYAVLPVESAPLVIDATQLAAGPRPYSDLKLTQTLDERQAAQGKLILELSASAHGLVPDLSEIVDLAPVGFDVVAIDDQGISVAKFDDEGDQAAIVSERLWMVSMEAKQKLEELPTSFEFAAPLVDDVELEYQRFVDADLESVERVISLEQAYGERAISFLAWGIGILLFLGLGVVGLTYKRASRGASGPARRFQMPADVSAFTVIGLLKDIESCNGISEVQRVELLGNIEHLESYYFGDEEREAPDLREIAQRWLQRTS